MNRQLRRLLVDQATNQLSDQGGMMVTVSAGYRWPRVHTKKPAQDREPETSTKMRTHTAVAALPNSQALAPTKQEQMGTTRFPAVGPGSV